MPRSRLFRGAILLGLLSGAACSKAPEPDAYGTFEATEVMVSAETSGKVLQFFPVEGARLERGVVVAVIDTSQLVLEQRQIEAQRAAAGARTREAGEQLGVLQVQYDIARRAWERTQRLYDQQAATAAQRDQAEREYRSLGAQMEALRAQRQSVGMDAASAEARVDQIRDRLAKSRVENPVAGTVLTTFARAGEIVQPGSPLYRIADLDTLVFRAYVTGRQLNSFRLGQAVLVHVDREDSLVTLPGTITWVSPTAEFTPTPIQTRDERADLVYAVKIRVPNRDGWLKIGMPGDLALAVPADSTSAEPPRQ